MLASNEQDHLQHAPYGGQAVIEGVMMRSPRFFAVACRRANNEIVIRQESVESILKKFQWLNKPFLRGTLALIDAMVLGVKALMFSADVAMEDIEQTTSKKGKKAQEAAGESPAEKPSKPKGQSINDITVGASMILGVALGIGIFMIGPHLLADLLKKAIQKPIWLNLAEGMLRIGLFVGYVAAISLMKDIRRVFQYHGAEHKVINTMEAGLDLSPENFEKHRTIHPRCGTSFILVVLVVSIIVYSFLGWHNAWYLRVGYRLLLLPVIAGAAYEVIRFAGRHKDSRILAAILSPGLLMQRLTTREPSDDQVEVALRALQTVMDKEAEDNA